MNIDAGARAFALCERARLAIDRSRELVARTARSRARAAAQAGRAAVRQAYVAQRTAAAATPSPWARAARRIAHAFPANESIPWRAPVHRARAGRLLSAAAASGRVVRQPPRRRQATAREAGDGSSDGDGAPSAQAPRPRVWAHATVLAERFAFDGKGAEWKVRELDARGLPGARCPRCLIFENHHIVRKLWDYPEDWLKLGDAALLALSRGTP